MSAHVLPCPDCGGTGEVSLGHPNDPYATAVPCEHCDGTGEFPCDGSCDRDECAGVEALPYVLPEVMACL